MGGLRRVAPSRTTDSPPSRLAALLALVGALAVAGLGACGSGGGGGASDLPPPAVVSVRFVGSNGTEITAVNSAFVPRNAWVEIVFSTPIDPATAIDPNVRVRSGPYFQLASQGTFHLEGQRLLFDPTVTASGAPRPLGFDSSADYEIRIPSGVPTGDMLRGTGGKEILTTFVHTFRTTEGWIAESVPPSLVSSKFEPGAVAGQVGPNAALILEFSETIAPASATSSVSPVSPGPTDAIDARFVPNDSTNIAAGIAGSVALVRVTQTTSTTLRVEPVFSWGDGPFVFDVSVLPGLKDLAGNALSPSKKVGPFRCTGGGVPAPRKILVESFESTADRDAASTDAAWGPTAATGVTLTTRRVRVLASNILQAQKAMGYGYGLYVVYASPLVGVDLNNVQTPVPATNLGRRVLLSFGAEDLGEKGTVVSAAWGPDRNATFLAAYPQVVLRLGYGQNGSLSLGSTFSGSYASPPVEVYRGSYSVAQRANVGNETPALPNTTGVAAFQPLFDYTGFVEWPAFQTLFEWDPASAPGVRDRTMLFDVSAAEGNTWQDQRAYFSLAYAALPSRRLIGVFESDAADPPNVYPIVNPDASAVDTAFTLATRRAMAQSLFYTPEPVDLAGNVYAGPPSVARTLGTRSDYGDAVLQTSALPSGASIVIEYQGAMGLDPTSGRSRPDLSKPMTPWTTRIDDCDRYPFLRWRLTLLTAIPTGGIPAVDSVLIPIRDTGP